MAAAASGVNNAAQDASEVILLPWIYTSYQHLRVRLASMRDADALQQRFEAGV
jgi:hypothetical protein